MKTQETTQTLPFEYGKPAIPAYLHLVWAKNTYMQWCFRKTDDGAN